MVLSFPHPLVLKCHLLKETFLAHPCHSLDTDPVLFPARPLPDMKLNIYLFAYFLSESPSGIPEFYESIVFILSLAVILSLTQWALNKYSQNEEMKACAPTSGPQRTDVKTERDDAC